MKKLTILVIALVFGLAFNVQAQTADEVINNYFENTGGVDNWEAIEGVKFNGKVNQGGMEIPVTVYNLTDGRQAIVINFQGKEIKQEVFDGETLWSHNFQNQKAEKSDAEATANMKLNANDFPDPFLDYKDKGYTVESMGKEDFNGTEVIKIKLVQEPITVDGKEEENVSYYYFDAENMVPIALHKELKSGPAKGQMSETLFSDYQEAGNIYMPYSLTQGLKGQPGAVIKIESIEINPEVDDAIFAFPEADGDN